MRYFLLLLVALSLTLSWQASATACALATAAPVATGDRTTDQQAEDTEVDCDYRIGRPAKRL